MLVARSWWAAVSLLSQAGIFRQLDADITGDPQRGPDGWLTLSVLTSARSWWTRGGSSPRQSWGHIASMVAARPLIMRLYEDVLTENGFAGLPVCLLVEIEGSLGANGPPLVQPLIHHRLRVTEPFAELSLRQTVLFYVCTDVHART